LINRRCRRRAEVKSRVEASDEDRDVFGDGTVRILKAPGHTPGSRMLLVKLAKSGPMLITGDLFHTRENYEKDLVPSVNISRADTLASSQRLRRIAANTHARVVIQHDPTDFSSMPVFPKYLD
jgi:N-acyl homoserine lactone hydrolase